MYRFGQCLVASICDCAPELLSKRVVVKLRPVKKEPSISNAFLILHGSPGAESAEVRFGCVGRTLAGERSVRASRRICFLAEDQPCYSNHRHHPEVPI